MTTILQLNDRSARRGKRPWRGIAMSICVVAILAGAASAGDRSSGRHARKTGEDFEWHGHVAAGKMIEVKGVNGGIVAEATTGDEVEVLAWKTAHKSDPQEVSIEVIEHDGSITLCAVYPTPHGEPANACKPGEDGRMNTRNNDVAIDFTVRVPKGVRFVGRTVNGGIEVRDLTADAEAHTINGSLKVSTRGTVVATTVNGSIDVEMGSAPRGPVEFTTVNGDILLGIPRTTDADVRASTVNGSISSEMPINVYGRISRRRLKGTLGDGGPEVVMSTVNGDIRLREAS